MEVIQYIQFGATVPGSAVCGAAWRCGAAGPSWCWPPPPGPAAAVQPSTGLLTSGPLPPAELEHCTIASSVVNKIIVLIMCLL